jgi:uncharacterized repeat protein (TIGR01451 family)
MLKAVYNRPFQGLAAILLAGLAPFALTAPAYAAGTIAGTKIVNVAQASFDGPDGPETIDSNEVTINVDELLDVTVVSSDPGDVAVIPGATQEVLTYNVTNTGNGDEAFRLTADTARTGDDFDASLEQIVLDSNGNGVYDPGVDTVYTPGSNDPVLSPDQSIIVFILSTIPDDASDSQRAEVQLLADAVTGTGAPGDLFAGQGDGGGDAVVGSTGADGAESGFFAIRAVNVELVKSATIVDPFGGSEAVPGAVITYQLVATVTGTGSVNGLTITDAVPADTSYVTASITLDSAAQTDAADGDAGRFSANAVNVALGDVAGGTTRTVTFQVTIN